MDTTTSVDIARKISEVRRTLLLGAISPVYIVLILSIALGVVHTTIRFNHVELIFPFISRILPPMLIVYTLLFGVYIIYTFSKTRDLDKVVNHRLDFIKRTMRLPKSLGILSLIFWFLAAASTFFILYAFEIIDTLTIVSISVLIFALGPLVAISIKTITERNIAEVMSFYRDEIDKDEINKMATDKVKKKVLHFASASIFACASVIIIFSGEILSRNIKDTESKNYLDRYFRGENIPNKIDWRIDEKDDKKSSLIDSYIRKAIIYKIERGENILYDYLSSSIFIFSRKEKAIEGVFIPLPEAEQKAIEHILTLSIVSILVYALLFVVYSTSIGRYLADSLANIGKRVWFGGDEFTPLSVELILMKKELEQKEAACNGIRENSIYILSYVFSELITMRATLNSILSSIRGLKLSINRAIQLTGKDMEEIELQIQNIQPIPTEQVNSLLKTIKEVENHIDVINTETQNIIRYAEPTAFSIKTVTEKQHDGRFSTVETSIVKRLEIMGNTIRELEGAISKAANVLKSIQANISKFRELLKTIDEILLDTDRLKKKLFVLSMNISIVSGKTTQEDIMEELSSIAKQMSSLLSDELKKVEIGLKNLNEHIRKQVSNLTTETGDHIGESYMISAEGIAGRIDDTIEQLYTDVKYVIDHANDMRKNIKALNESLTNILSYVKRTSGYFSKIVNVASSTHEELTKLSSGISSINEQLTTIGSDVEKLFRDSKNIVSRYKTMVSEFNLTVKNIRTEVTKMYESYGKFETTLQKVVSDIEKVTEAIQDTMYKLSKEI